jgi:hypothetical protein
MSTEIEHQYRQQATKLVDLLVDKGFIRDDVSREETRVLEDYIGFLFQSNATAVRQTAELLRKYKEKK